MKYILAWDSGFGDQKVTVYNENGEILKIFKFPSMIAITKKNLILHLFGRNCRPKVPLVFITAAGIIENWKKKSGVSLKKIKKKKTKLLMKTLIYLNVN